MNNNGPKCIPHELKSYIVPILVLFGHNIRILSIWDPFDHACFGVRKFKKQPLFCSLLALRERERERERDLSVLRYEGL